MKKIVFLFALIPFLFAFQCDPEPGPCGEFIEFEKSDLITIENQQTTYQVGDLIWLSSIVDRFQVNPITEASYDLFSSDQKLAYSLEFSKTSLYNGSIYLNINENTTVIEEGELDWNTIVLTKNDTQFKSKIGIKLLEPGTFTLNIYNIGSFNPDRVGCNFTTYSMKTDFNGIESNLFTFEVE
ncbi:MAG TPA: hypothetical protein P5335_05965 [Flavobacterium sp.]|jgi:hypothetical protein|nr:hypothetical protein [Flavobacterium sp.]HRZ74456.1 hypothetical protein [Flavobacterium sp.]